MTKNYISYQHHVLHLLKRKHNVLKVIIILGSLNHLIEGSIFFSYKIEGSNFSRYVYRKIFIRRGQPYYERNIFVNLLQNMCIDYIKVI